MHFRNIFLAAIMAAEAAAAIGGQNMHIKRDSDGLQDIVTYDEHSLIVYGQRIFLFSGEFHPYRLPVPDLWLDIFQKVKALGFTAVSFYTDWALLEGKPGVYNASGIFALEPFFDAASTAGIYLIARPGPHINAESSGGGFPGWIQRIKGVLRTRAPDYLAATDYYAGSVGRTIAKYQITNGGPVILLQPENEYTGAVNVSPFPDPVYLEYVENQFRDAGIVVPLINNDASPKGYFAPGSLVDGTSAADVNIYGHDSYPLGFDCANPYSWPDGDLPTYFHTDHENQSPSTFYALNEFQGGSFDPWGGLGFDQCAILLNEQFERVFNKNNFAAASVLLNLYMTYGGTNWGNIGHAGGYTSYDYGSPITENRELTREKYSELKLEANFLKVSPSWLTVSVGSLTTTYTNNDAIAVTPLFGNGSATNYYVIRHSNYAEQLTRTYKLKLSTSKGNFTIPQLNGSLTLNARDSKWAVTDYDIGGSTILYSTAEIFTWQKYGNYSYVFVYGGPGELHELALISSSEAKILEGTGISTRTANDTTILNWQTVAGRRVVQIKDVFVYIFDRNTAYNLWTVDFVRTDSWGAFTSNLENRTSLVVEAGYLIRNVSVDGSTLKLDGDLNATVPIRLVGAPASASVLLFNGEVVSYEKTSVTGEWTSTLKYTAPKLDLPDLEQLDWKYIDSLPELHSSYDDSAWKIANNASSNNPTKLTTPTSLYASDYGYHTGVLVYRGHFTATGSESNISLWTQGGSGFGSSVWLNDTYIGSWKGADYAEGHNDTYILPNLTAGKKYVFTVVVDNNGLDENWTVGEDEMKTPRGIIDYSLGTRNKSVITWKLSGNLGGEDYVDKVRGPLNEGGLYAERQGYHQPSPPSGSWASKSPLTGLSAAGIGFYATSFKLSLPEKYDVPLTFNFGNTTLNDTTANYQAQLWVNGYQFGKYINNVGPQTSFPVPQGILDYHGTNWLAVEIWSRQAGGARLSELTLKAGTPVKTALKAPELAPAPAYSKRSGAY